MQWAAVAGVVLLLFVLLRFLNSAFAGKRSGASKVVNSCSLGNAASVVSIQGARSYQEDKYVAKLSFCDDPTCAFFGVFDGHGGARASEYLAKNLHESILREIAQTTDPSVALRLVVFVLFISFCFVLFVDFFFCVFLILKC